MNIVELYSVIVYILLIGMLGLLIVNIVTFPKLKNTSVGAQFIAPNFPHPSLHNHPSNLPALSETPDQPFVSILVPARDEAHCIERCVRSLVKQRYKRLEILVLDDGSSDNTALIVQRIIDELPSGQHGRLRLLSGEILPEGWIGKNYACYQLAQHAQGDYLLFTDADTIHAPETVGATITCMNRYEVKLLTAQPAFELRSFGERLIVPLLNFTLMTLLPLALIRVRPEPSLTTGNGQFLCFHRSAYEAIGGHATVKGKILEDVLLARKVKMAGFRMIFVDAFEYVQCRMYRSLNEVWQGFSKNLFAFYSYSLLFALLALILNIALFVGPPILVLAAFMLHLSAILLWLNTGAYILVALMRLLLLFRFPSSGRGSMFLSCLFCLLHPFAIVLECLILLNSMRWHYRKSGTMWKGRQYPRYP